ncbi:DeoR faimly transcriptional regulator [Bacteroidetes bacterium UKL13-3]|jgi:diacylglycerol kinase (ATP)|nr:DeoR faimly transcriptional regulator [Bacteroidetes bacterium UKL13-3]HCP92479.1 diacylglycerol kinase [Bacteroidota bacterium]
MNKISRLIKSFDYAIKGILAATRTEQNLQIHLWAVAVVSIAGVVFNISEMEWIILLTCFGVVLSAELFNSAIEKLVDLVSPEFNIKAGLIKDIAAGAVLVLVITAAIIGCLIFIPKLM